MANLVPTSGSAAREQLLILIEDLQLDTVRMTCEEIAEVTGASSQLVKNTLKENALPYVAERLSMTSDKTTARSVNSRPGSSAHESPELLASTFARNGIRLPKLDRATRKVLSLGKRTSSMTISEIGAAVGLSYLDTQRILVKYGIRHL